MHNMGSPKSGEIVVKLKPKGRHSIGVQPVGLARGKRAHVLVLGLVASTLASIGPGAAHNETQCQPGFRLEPAHLDEIPPGSNLGTFSLHCVPDAARVVPSVPAAPTNLVADANCPSTFDFRWDDNSTDEHGFRLYDVEQNTVEEIGPNGDSSGQWLKDWGTFLGGSRHRYSISAFNAAGESVRSNEVFLSRDCLPSVVIPPAPPSVAPPPPKNVKTNEVPFACLSGPGTCGVPQTCQSITFIGVRGSGENLNDGDPSLASSSLVARTFREFAAVVGVSKVKGVGLNYPAVSADEIVPNLLNKRLELAANQALVLGPSIDLGVAGLIQLIGAQPASACIVIAAYSQGVLVVAKALHGDPGLADKVDGVVLYGDPAFVSRSFTNGPPTAKGLLLDLPFPATELPGKLARRGMSYCLEGDIFCDAKRPSIVTKLISALTWEAVGDHEKAQEYFDQLMDVVREGLEVHGQYDPRVGANLLASLVR